MILVAHKVQGLLLDLGLGSGFWSQITPNASDQAMVFDTENDARSLIYELGFPPAFTTKLDYVYVSEDLLQKFNGATADLCAQLNLPRWSFDHEDVCECPNCTGASIH